MTVLRFFVRAIYYNFLKPHPHHHSQTSLKEKNNSTSIMFYICEVLKHEPLWAMIYKTAVKLRGLAVTVIDARGRNFLHKKGVKIR